jgi:hypothetical protein
MPNDTEAYYIDSAQRTAFTFAYVIDETPRGCVLRSASLKRHVLCNGRRAS